MSISEILAALYRRFSTRLAHVVTVLSGVLAVFSIIYLIADSFIHDATGHERFDHTLILIVFGALILSAEWRNWENQRAARYRSAIRYVHKCIHHLRDLHFQVQTAELKFKAADAHPDSIQKCMDDALLILSAATENIRAAFEHVTSHKVRVCIKYVYIEKKKTYVPTLLRDKDSWDKFAIVDQLMVRHGLDALEKNAHFSNIVNEHNAVWCIRRQNNKSLRDDFPSKAQLAYKMAEKDDPVESALFGAISLNPNTKPTNAYALIPRRGIRTDDTDSAVKIIGVLCVDTAEKESFRQTDEELLYVFADALFWALARVRQMAKYKADAESRIEQSGTNSSNTE